MKLACAIGAATLSLLTYVTLANATDQAAIDARAAELNAEIDRLSSQVNCQNVYRVAKNAQSLHQNGATLDEMLESAHPDLVTKAVAYPVMNTEENKAKMVEKFGKELYLLCEKAKNG